MEALLILYPTFFFITIIVIKIFPVSLFDREAAKEEGLIYQIKPILEILAKYNALFPIPKYREKIKNKLAAAGDPVYISADEFLALKELLSLLGALIFGIVFQGFLLIIIGGLLGFFLPNIWMNDILKNRRKIIQRTLPDFLDMMTLTVEAGLDFGAALERVLHISKKNPLIDEFTFALQEMRLGTTRQQALRNLATRVNLIDISAFISSLIQADQLGASLGPAMRIQADQMRTKRMQRAEKAGGEAPVKMLMPLMLFILPAVFIMLFGPIIIKFMQGGLN